jgi:hypothetical protein
VFVGDMRLVSHTLPVLKLTGAILVTEDLLKVAVPEAIGILRNELVNGAAYSIDQTMLDQTLTAVTDTSPASITAAAPSFGSAGTSSANALTDLKKLFQVHFTANPGATNSALVMSAGNAAAAAAATNWPALSANGNGSLWGVTVVPTGAAGNRVVMLDANALLVADQGGVDVRFTRHASIEVDGATTSPPTASTILVSTWQSNLAAAKITRWLNFKMARPNAVTYTVASYA